MAKFATKSFFVSVFSFVLITTSFVTLGVPKEASAAFGISPPFVHATYLVRGVTFRQTIFLVRDQADVPIGVKAEFLKIPEEIRSWVSINPGFNFIIPEGVRQFPVEIIINVPKDAPLTAYSGILRFATGPATPATEGGQVAIAYGLQLNIEIAVGTDIHREFRALIDILDIEEGWSPRVHVKFENKGNIAESLDNARFEMFDIFKAARIAFIPESKKGDLVETKPFSTNEYVVEFPLNTFLGTGEYWGNVQLFKEGEVVASKETVFKVLERGTLSSPFSQFLQSLQENWIYYAGAGIVLVSGITFYTRKRRRRRRRKLAY